MEKMVFIGGPRLVGKTTLAKEFIKKPSQYLTWDDLDDRTLIKKHQIDPTLKVVVLDEVHKYSRWRTLVKGLYDKLKDSLSIIVTGSAQLDHLRKGGDSLVGRYHYYRLHPLTLSEVDQHYTLETINNLLRYSGFPEPFIRDIDLREIDFVVLKEKKPLFAVECKTGEKQISPHIRYFRERTPIPKFYQVHLGQKKYQDGNIYVLPFTEFCKLEGLV